MSDDLDDEDNLDLDDSSFDDFDKKTGTLGDLWRDNPLAKVGIVVAAVVVIIAVILFLGRKEDVVDPSIVSTAPDISAPPGTGGATPEYIEAVEEENEARVEQAYKEGTSALPTPIEPPVGRLSVPEEQREIDDPLQRWRRLQEERLERELQQQQVIEPVDVGEDTERSESIQALSDLMAEQMSAILEQTSDVKVSHLSVTDPGVLEDLQQQEDLEADEFEDVALAEVIFPAGQILYAQLITEANTDAPGPVLAEIVSGPLKGARILGSFQEENELLTLDFNTLVLDGVSRNISAIAIDPDTTLPGLATDVNHHYLKRVILPVAAAFVEGAANAAANAGRTNVTVNGDVVIEEEEDADIREEVASGVEDAGQELRTILDEIAADTEVTVRIQAGTPLGILFLEPVTDGDDLQAQ